MMNSESKTHNKGSREEISRLPLLWIRAAQDLTAAEPHSSIFGKYTPMKTEEKAQTSEASNPSPGGSGEIWSYVFWPDGRFPWAAHCRPGEMGWDSEWTASSHPDWSC